MTTIALIAILALAPAVAAESKTAKPKSSPSPGPSGASWECASPPAFSAARPLHPVAAPAAVGGRGAPEALQRATPVAVQEGEATLLIDGSPLSLRPGSVVGTDVVKSVGSDRVILVRGATAANPGGSATVVLSFDRQGRARVRVYSVSDAAAIVPREVH